VWKLPQIVHAQAPAGTQPGVTYNSDGTVTLALFAPYKKFVMIQGDFNNWNGSETVMNVQDNGLWWKTLSLSPGTHEFQYVVDGSIVIADPFSEDVDWTENGQEDWHPQHARTVLPVPKPTFAWEDANYVPLQKEDYMIYEIHVGDFTPEGTFAGVIGKLNYLKDLGVTAIELMPTYEFPGGHSWGYNPTFYMAPESSYGTPQDFKRLVNEAHKSGIAVLMDMVYNHSDATCPFYVLYKNDYDHSPYYHATANMWGFPDFDHYKPATQQFVDRVNKFWMQEYHVDGFRFDYTRGYDQSSETGNLNLLNRMATVAHLNNPKAYLIAEHLPQDPKVATSTQMDAEWHDTFHDQMKANLREGQFEGSTYADLANTARAIDFALDGFTAPFQVVNYLESHDEQRVIYEVQTNHAIGYDLALQKSKLGACVLFTAAGNPMMYMGEEFGMDTPKTLDWNKLKWQSLSEPKTKELYHFYRRLMRFRKNHPALRKGTIRILKKFVSQKTIVYERQLGDQKIVVAANFSRSPQTLNIPLDGQTKWYEFVTDTSCGVTDTLKNFVLTGSAARIFTNFRDWIPLSVQQRVLVASVPKEFRLFQNYPNPFNPTTEIRYWLPRAQRVQIAIFDLQGRRVATLVHARKPAGVYSVKWNARGVPSGIYFYKMIAGSFVATKKLLLLK
jgi:1,4-alpha-glucan branching enzyme